MNAATHPVITYLFPILGPGHSVASAVLAGEIFAWFVETGVLRVGLRRSWGSAATLSGTMNLFSWWAGSFLL